MISTVTAKRETIYARKENTFSFNVVVTDPEGVAIDMTAYSPRFRVIDTAGIPFIDLTVANGGIVALGTNGWTISRSAIMMNYSGRFRYIFSISETADWLFGDFIINADVEAETASQGVNISLSETVTVQVSLAGGAGGAAADIPSEVVAAKYESLTDVNRFSTTYKTKLDELYGRSELDLLIENLEAKITHLEEQLQNTGVAPTLFSITSDTIPDGSTGGYRVGIMSVQGNPPPIMALTGSATGDIQYFEIREQNQLWFIGTADYDSGKTFYNITIACTNGISPSLQVGLRIDVEQQEIGVQPIFLGLSQQSIMENVAIGTTVGTILYESDQVPTITLSGTTKFTVSGNSLITADSLSHYDEPEHTFNIILSNDWGTVTTEVTIYVEDATDTITVGRTPDQSYSANSSFIGWGTLTDKVSFGFRANLQTTDTGTILEKSDGTEGLGIWCADGKLRARMGGNGTTNNANTCFIEVDIAPLAGLREYLFCFIPGPEMRIVIYVDNLKLSYNRNGNYANAASASGGGYGKSESTTAPGIVTGVFSGVAANRLELGYRYDNWVPTSA